MRDYNRMHNAFRLEEDNKNVIAQVAQEVGTDKDHIKKNFDKIHPIVDLKDESTRRRRRNKNLKVHHTQFQRTHTHPAETT